jgi:hypothetical protein
MSPEVEVVVFCECSTFECSDDEFVAAALVREGAFLCDDLSRLAAERCWFV